MHQDNQEKDSLAKIGVRTAFDRELQKSEKAAFRRHWTQLCISRLKGNREYPTLFYQSKPNPHLLNYNHTHARMISTQLYKIARSHSDRWRQYNSHRCNWYQFMVLSPCTPNSEGRSTSPKPSRVHTSAPTNSNQSLIRFCIETNNYAKLGSPDPSQFAGVMQSRSLHSPNNFLLCQEVLLQDKLVRK